MKAWLVLEDGRWFVGVSVGASGRATGEVVFNTGLTGYQEILTDPSYCGQIVTLTYPHIGNTGINQDDSESARPHLRALIVRDASRRESNWRSRQTLLQYLNEHGIMAITGIDTRADLLGQAIAAGIGKTTPRAGLLLDCESPMQSANGGLPHHLT